MVNVKNLLRDGSVKKLVNAAMPVELREAQAYRVGAMPERNKSARAMASHLADSPEYSQAERGNIEVAFDQIDRLIALGVHQREIARLVAAQDAQVQDVSSETYRADPFPLVSERIRKEEAQLGITPKETEKLVEAHALEREIASLRARQIAQEEIKKAHILQTAK